MALKEYKPGTTFPGRMGRTIGESEPAWPSPVRAREGAPNVLFIVIDDTGFGQLGCYGSPINTPNIDKLAKNGLLFTNMHTTALCSPSRSCILTGRNHHSNAMSCITEGSTGYPGGNGAIPFENGFLSDMLLQQGYATYCIGKWHLTPSEQISAAGPYDRWPLGRGFERYYGFFGGDTHQYYPDLVYDNHQVEPPKTPEEGYHLTADLADKAIGFIADLKQVAPDKPFFLYFAPGANHAPHHVPKEWSDKYKGKFDEGWDVYREKVFARQKELGIMPKDAKLSRHDPDVQEWAKLPADERKLYARMMEVFAGFCEHMDHHVGRLIDFIDHLGELDNTLIMFISDNGASSEGGPHGSVNENKFFNNVPDDLKQNLAAIDELGGPKYFNHYAWGWTHAGNTPFKRWKRETYRGGTADPFLVHWPKGVKGKGKVCHQFAHAIDMVPSVLEALGVEAPTQVRGVSQSPLEGVSFAHVFQDAKAESRHKTQYFEMFAHRSIYHDGWRAVCPVPGTSFKESGTFFGMLTLTEDMLRELDAKHWELYDLSKDPTETTDLAASNRAKLIEMIALWYTEAGKYKVFPLDSRGTLRFADERPAVDQGSQDLRLLSTNADDPGECRGEALEQVAQSHGGRGDSQGRRGGRADLSRRQCRRLHALREGQEAPLCPQLCRRGGISSRVERRRAGGQSLASLRVREDRRAGSEDRQGVGRQGAALHQQEARGRDEAPLHRAARAWHRQRRLYRAQFRLAGERALWPAIRVHRHDQ